MEGIDNLLAAVHEFQITNNYNERQVAGVLESIAETYEGYASFKNELTSEEIEVLAEVMEGDDK